MPITGPYNTLLFVQLDLIREIGRNLAGTSGKESLPVLASNMRGQDVRSNPPGESLLPAYPDHDLGNGLLQAQHSLFRDTAPTTYQSLAGLRAPKWSVCDGPSRWRAASANGHQDDQEYAIYARGQGTDEKARTASSFAGGAPLTGEDGMSDGRQENAIQRSRAASATESSAWSAMRAGAYYSFGGQILSRGSVVSAALIGTVSDVDRDAGIFPSAGSLPWSEMLSHRARPGNHNDSFAPAGVQIAEGASIQSAWAGEDALATTEQRTQAALASPTSDRAGVLASFILNAHFLPGWPPLLPNHPPGVTLCNQQHPLIYRFGLSDIEILAYLANIGLTRVQIRNLVNPRQRSGLQDAILGFVSNLATLLCVLQSERASISEELTFRDGSFHHRRAGRVRIEAG